MQGPRRAQAPPAQRQISDLIKSGSAGVREQGGAAASSVPAAPAGTARRPAGFDEGRPPTSTRTPLRDTDLAGGAPRSYVGERGLPVEVVQGSTARPAAARLRNRVRGRVFRALLASSAALLDAQKRFPGAVDSIEMVCETSDGNLGARFTLSPQQAIRAALEPPRDHPLLRRATSSSER